MNDSHAHALRTPAPRQQGLALMMALIALVAMTLAGIALVRSIDTNALIAGNLAFRQSATLSAEQGIEAAIKTLSSLSASAREQDQAGKGYFSTMQDAGLVDGKGIDYTGNRTAPTNDNIQWKDQAGTAQDGAVTPFCQADPDAAGNRICYIIHRQCKNPGSPTVDNTQCIFESVCKGGNRDSKSGEKVSTTYNYLSNKEGTGVCAKRLLFYKITVRAASPRGNSSYVQAFVKEAE